MPLRPGLVPIVDRPRYADMMEHTAVDMYRYGEYPRYINPPGWRQPRTKEVLMEFSDAPSCQHNTPEAE